VGFVLQGIRPAAEVRSRGGQRKVVGDKGTGGFVLQGVKPAAALAPERAVLIISDQKGNYITPASSSHPVSH
jgi:hypothetical protein